MPLHSFEIAILSIGLTPFAALAIAAGVIWFGRFYQLFSLEDLTQILLLIGGIWLFVMLVLLFVTNMCAKIRPRELFADGDGTAADPYQALIREITLAETDVCLMITRVDKFIISSVGSPGKDTKAAAATAIDAARAPAGTITSCPSTWPKDLTDHDAILGEAANRMTRMESTLQNYTDPQLTKTYKLVVPCESFATAGGSVAEQERLVTLGQLRERLAKITAVITAQQKNLLRPIENKQKELRSGKPSDCDKAKGSKQMKNVPMISS